MMGDLVKEMSTPMSPSERMLAVGKQGSDGPVDGAGPG